MSARTGSLTPLGRTALGYLLAAAALAGATYLLFGPRPVFVHLRWSPGLAGEDRLQREQQYHLSNGENVDGRTWGYVLLDVSRGNIEALVRDPTVEDTHYIHRTAFRPWRTAPRRPFNTTRPWIPSALEGLALASLALCGAAIGLIALRWLVPASTEWKLLRVTSTVIRRPDLAVRTGLGWTIAWLGHRVPTATAESAGSFRIVFGVVLLAIVLQQPAVAEWATTSSNAVSPWQASLLRLFAAAPWLVATLPWWVAAWGALFVVGAWTRVSFGMLTVGVFAWAALHTTRTAHHTVTALLLTLLCLLGSRWGDGLSVDAWRARREGATSLAVASRIYGFSIWIPGLVLGLVFAAAAFAKLQQGGLGWILNGTVKYHFLADADQAIVGWGSIVGERHGLAVLLSAAAIAVESLVLVGVLSSRYVVRLVAGVASASLLCGFLLLQGLMWPGWWILLLSFLPWHLVGPRAEGAGQPAPMSRALPAAFSAIILALIAQQVAVSLLRIESPPLISAYDMYATTYASPEEFEENAGTIYMMVADGDAGQPYECRLTQNEAAMVVEGASGEGAGRTETRRLVRRCFPPSAGIRTIAVEQRRIRVDWARWRMAQSERVPLLDARTPP